MDTHTSFLSNNYLLNGLKPDALERFLPNLQEIDAYFGRILYLPHDPIEYVFFPNTSMASIVAITEEGRTTEIGVVGCEGAVGLEVVMGRTSSPNESMIQIANGGHRIATRHVIAEFERSAHTRGLLLAFVSKFLIQVSQTTLCNRLHNIDQRLARWLLLCHDRVAGKDIYLTHEFLALMLGATRTSVSIAAGSFQTLGLITYVRGNVTIADHDGLQAASCECYAVVKEEYDKTECFAD